MQVVPSSPLVDGDTEDEIFAVNPTMLMNTEQSRGAVGDEHDVSRVMRLTCSHGHREYAEAGGRPRAEHDEDDHLPAKDDVNTTDYSAVTASDAAAALEQLLDGVYPLKGPMQRKIATLLRTLFVVQQTNDKCIMAFLGIAHYLMAFSQLVGVSSSTDRSEIFDALLVAFKHPASMKVFWDSAFGTWNGRARASRRRPHASRQARRRSNRKVYVRILYASA